jgi:ABC-type antimicrobial peptide transport system permease subunit
VVGEIGDVKQRTADAATQEQIYQPTDQLVKSFGTFAPPGLLGGASGSIVLRSLLPPEQVEDALRTTVRSIDPQLPLIHVEPMQRVVEEGQAARRFNAMLISSFAGAAVLLALLGIYSVIAFSAALRTKEMAIRLALGSQRASLMQLILVSAGKLILMGCGVGMVWAIFPTYLLRSFLFQIDPLDPTVIVLAVMAIFLLALLASIIPAHRAASADPIQALRAE